MTVVYDTGVLIAADRDDRKVWAAHLARLELGILPVVTAPVIAQASRSPRQVPLRRFLRGCQVAEFTEADGHSVGVLLRKAGTSDVVDAHVALIASRLGGIVLTSDLGDLQELAEHCVPRVHVKSVDERTN